MPNGYGKQSLYKLEITYAEDGVVSEEKIVRFGFRTVSLIEDDLPTGGNLIRLFDHFVYILITDVQ